MCSVSSDEEEGEVCRAKSGRECGGERWRGVWMKV